MVSIIYPAELQLYKAKADTQAAFLDLNLSIHNDKVSTNIYMIYRMILILILLTFRSLMAMSLDVPLMVFIYVYVHVSLNLFALPEHLRMLLTSIIVINS